MSHSAPYLHIATEAKQQTRPPGGYEARTVEFSWDSSDQAALVRIGGGLHLAYRVFIMLIGIHIVS
jgi:hypothetical protein